MEGTRHQKKYAKTLLTAGTLLAGILIMLFCFPRIARCGVQNDPEEQAVMQAATKYLDAEVRKDYPAVYASFAPSSDYAQSNRYEQYLAEAQLAQQHVVKYRIIAITYIKKNEKKLTLSAIDKIAEVEVDVTFLHTATRQQSEINIGFIFFKEGGKWYKS